MPPSRAVFDECVGSTKSRCWKRLTSAQKAALFAYLQLDSRGFPMQPPSKSRAGILNAHLWGHGKIPAAQAQAIARIDEALAVCDNTLPLQDTILFKGVRAINYKGWRVGSVKHIPAFSSSSTSLHRALNYASSGDRQRCILKLSFDKNSPVRYFSSSFEEEVVLERDVCFKLISRSVHVCGSECQHTGFAKSEQMLWKGAKLTMLDVLVVSSA